jgi:hypothetical protein
MYYVAPNRLAEFTAEYPHFRRVGQTAGGTYFVDPRNDPITVTPKGAPLKSTQPTVEPAFRPRKQTPNYDRGRFRGLPSGAEFSLMNQEPLASRTWVSPVDASRLTNETRFLSNPSWQSYLLDYSRPGEDPQNDPAELPETTNRVPQPRPDPVNTRPVRGQRADVSPRARYGDTTRKESTAVNPVAALLGPLVSGRAFRDPARVDLAASDPRLDPVWRTRQMRQMQQAGLGPREILQVLLGSGRRATGTRQIVELMSKRD